MKDDHLRLSKCILRSSVWATLLVTVACAGCQPAAPKGGGAPAPKAEEPDAPKGEAIADPVLREARDQVDAVLKDLLAGKLDQDENFAPVARKLKGYQSWSIKSQQLARDGAADFRGVLTAPGARARLISISSSRRTASGQSLPLVAPTPNEFMAEPTDEADRGRHSGFARYQGLAGGPGSLSLSFGSTILAAR